MTDNLLTLAGAVAIVLAGLAALAAVAVIAVRAMRRREDPAADRQMAELARLQAETSVRIEGMRDMQDGLPKGAFAFQHTLKNGKRPDCAVFLPDGRPLVIDAKFPLEAVTAFRDAATDDERSRAAQRLRHDIAEKYLVPGETQDTALMFVPSESVYAELHDGFDDIVQKAYRARVVLVSPALLMLAIQVIQQIQKDARMREAADQIHAEVDHLMDDL